MAEYLRFVDDNYPQIGASQLLGGNISELFRHIGWMKSVGSGFLTMKRIVSLTTVALKEDLHLVFNRRC
jgi:hypothetical protein